ncbi:hypothetical protein V1477_016432 [Vespula maculifrons]|uniref:Uncharacterized protein n=2 Tax=Vespula TaxID=7451 RepID=A0A834N8N7_VESVU|nr:hypothetical protein HZH66_006886 [Vespula vulgaris]
MENGRNSVLTLPCSKEILDYSYLYAQFQPIKPLRHRRQIASPSRHSVAVTDVAAVATAVAATAAIATAAAAADAVGREINTSSSLKLACEEHEESVIMSRNGLLKLGNRTRGYCSF